MFGLDVLEKGLLLFRVCIVFVLEDGVVGCGFIGGRVFFIVGLIFFVGVLCFGSCCWFLKLGCWFLNL